MPAIATAAICILSVLVAIAFFVWAFTKGADWAVGA